MKMNRSIFVALLATCAIGVSAEEKQTTTTATEQPEVQVEAQASDNNQISEEEQKKQQKEQSVFTPEKVTDDELKKKVSEVNKASSFIGMQVQNMEKEKLGKVHELVFDPATGRISYAVVSTGEFLGVSDKLIAVPLTSLRAMPGQDFLVLDMKLEQVESAPGLAKNAWPDLDAEGLGAPAGGESEAKEEEIKEEPKSETEEK